MSWRQRGGNDSEKDEMSSKKLVANEISHLVGVGANERVKKFKCVFSPIRYET